MLDANPPDVGMDVAGNDANALDDAADVPSDTMGATDSRVMDATGDDATGLDALVDAMGSEDRPPDVTDARVCDADFATDPAHCGSCTSTCTAGQTCAAGRCVARVCTPAETTCLDLHTRRMCDRDGAAFTSAACSAGTVCRGAGSCVSYADVVRATRPAVYWRFEESVGPVATDEVAHLTATATTGVTFARPGLVGGGRALAFNGGGRLEVPYTPTLNPASASVEAWVRVDGSPGTYRSVFTSREATPRRRGLALYFGDSNRWDLFYGDGSTSTWQTLSVSETGTLGRTYHVVVVFAAFDTRIYVDGSLAASSTAFSFAANMSGGARIGAGLTESPAPDYYFNGVIDELAVYPRALTGAEVADHWAVGSAL